MPWARLDDAFYDHPKLDALGSVRLPCVGLFVLALTWSNRYLTDGFIPAERVRKLGGTIPLAERLVSAGLWERAGEDYRFHDFHDWNETSADVRQRRQRMRELGKRGGEARRFKRDAQPDGLALRSNSVPLRTVPIHTVPSSAPLNGAPEERRLPPYEEVVRSTGS